MLRQEIARLRGLVSKAAYDLRDAGKDSQSRAPLRAQEARPRPQGGGIGHRREAHRRTHRHPNPSREPGCVSS